MRLEGATRRAAGAGGVVAGVGSGKERLSDTGVRLRDSADG